MQIIISNHLHFVASKYQLPIPKCHLSYNGTQGLTGVNLYTYLNRTIYNQYLRYIP